MANSRLFGPLGQYPGFLWHTPGPLGQNDAGDPDVSRIHTTDTPGPLGVNDWGDPNHPAYRARIRMGRWTTRYPSRSRTRSVCGAPQETATTTDIQRVIAALDSGRLRADLNNIKGQLRGLATDGFWTDVGQHEMRASPELIRLLAGLVEGKATMTLMSLFRFRNGAGPGENPHGTPQADGSFLGRAVDIMEYNGHKIHLKSPENNDGAILGVAGVISNLPTGTYTLGLPRPGGGTKIDPENDVFLPVTKLSDRQVSPSKGHLEKDLGLLRDPAQTAIRKAIAGNSRARIKYLYPDGVDHLHITVL